MLHQTFKMTNKLVPKSMCFCLTEVYPTFLHNTISLSSCQIFTCLYSHYCPCNNPLELRCLSWPWQNCHHLKSTHVGQQKEMLSPFHFHPCRSILTFTIIKNISSSFQSSDAKLQERLMIPRFNY